MKNYLFTIFLLCVVCSFAQHKILIKDKVSNLPLAHVEVYSEGYELLATSNQNGLVALNTQEKLIYLEHPRYPSQSFQLPIKNNLILLDSELVNLKELMVVANDDKSLNLIRQVIDNQKKNSPKSLENYSYNSYTKFWVDAQGDSIPFITNPTSEADSSQNDMKKFLEESMLFISERAISHHFDKKLGTKNVVEAARISGLKSPFYEMIALQPVSTEFNENEFNFFFRKFINPLSTAGLKTYNYRITDTIQKGNRNYVVVRFNSKQNVKKELIGFVHIDLVTYALAKFHAENQTKSGSDTYIEMQYKPYMNVWIPTKSVVKIDSKITVKEYGMSDGEIKKKDKKINSWITSKIEYGEFKSPVDHPKGMFKGADNEVTKEAFSEFEERIKTFREDTLTDREKLTYVKIDSIGKEEKIDRGLKLLRIITQQGWLNLGKVDLYLLDILQFNNYEDYRVGANIRTNSDFNRRFGLNARTYYGVSDKVFKYGIGAWWRLDANVNSEIFVDYSDDIASSGRFTPDFLSLGQLLRRRQEESSDYLYIDKVAAQIGYRQDFFGNLNVALSLNSAQERSLFDYSFKDNPRDKTYTTNTIRASLRYAPNDESIQTPLGKVTFNSMLPKYFLTIDKGLKTFDGETDFTRIEFSSNHRFSIFKSFTYLNLRMGKVFGEVPVWHYFDGLGRGKNKKPFWQRARFGGSQIFETMTQGEFVSDQFIFGSVKQRVLHLKVSKDKRIPFHVLYKAAYGTFDSPEFHQGLNLGEMNQVYQEAGLEIDQLLFNRLGLGLYYRFGAYSYGEFDRDFSLKAVINIGI